MTQIIVKLSLSVTLFWESVIEHRLRHETTISENQFGLMPGCSTMEAIFLLSSLTKKYRKVCKDLSGFY